MIKKINIGTQEIGDNYPPFIIAEACINHEGDIKKAKQMIYFAHALGADCIKFQIHNLENEMLRETPQSDNFEESLWEALDRTNFTIKEHIELKKLCEILGIKYLCTPFSRDGADALEEIGVEFFKTGSGELTNLPLIEHIAKKGKPMIISTGMSEMEEIKETVELVNSIGTDFILTHCTSAYPCPYEIINLGAINTLRDTFKVLVGLSDHSRGIYTALGAVALGACVIEKHFTLDKLASGPDHASSIEPDELGELVKGSKALFLASGSEKKVFDQEKQILAWARESVVSEKQMSAGHKIEKNDIWVKRPGPTGDVIPAKYYKEIIGRKLVNDIPKDAQIKWSDLEK